MTGRGHKWELWAEPGLVPCRVDFSRVSWVQLHPQKSWNPVCKNTVYVCVYLGSLLRTRNCEQLHSLCPASWWCCSWPRHFVMMLELCAARQARRAKSTRGNTGGWQGDASLCPDLLSSRWGLWAAGSGCSTEPPPALCPGKGFSHHHK